MRIVGGKFRGRSLATPKSNSTRPTSDKVRQAIFNMLEHGDANLDFAGLRVLDLFAGTGALGLEALSRGAGFVQFIDDDHKARGLIRSNADALGAIGSVKIWRRDAARLGDCAPMPGFDLVFADPPYGKGLGDKALAGLVNGGWLNGDAIVVLEEVKNAEISIPCRLETLKSRDYGDTRILFLRKAAE